MAARRKSRTIALQALFERDCSGHNPFDVLMRLGEENKLPDETLTFGRELVQGVIKNRVRIDGIIHDCAPAWPVAQLSCIDRNILRLAIFEILIDNRMPLKAAINEALELGKTFGGSTKFINGVLGAVSKMVDKKEISTY